MKLFAFNRSKPADKTPIPSPSALAASRRGTTPADRQHLVDHLTEWFCAADRANSLTAAVDFASNRKEILEGKTELTFASQGPLPALPGCQVVRDAGAVGPLSADDPNYISLAQPAIAALKQAQERLDSAMAAHPVRAAQWLVTQTLRADVPDIPVPASGAEIDEMARLAQIRDAAAKRLCDTLAFCTCKSDLLEGGLD